MQVKSTFTLVAALVEMSATSSQFKSKLDRPIPPERRLPFHAVLRNASLNTCIIPDDPVLTSRWFRLYQYFQIVFMVFFCTRRLVECLLPKGSIVYLYIGDFKVWWGEPYVANQVVWGMAAILVPCYQFINLQTICYRDRQWSAPFRFAQGLATARDIKLEDETQMVKLMAKMKFDYRQCFVMHYSVLGSYTIAVFVSYWFLVYKSYLALFTLGLFWTIIEAYWSRKITLNMGLYPACLEIITFYLHLRYDKAECKLNRMLTRFRSPKLYPNLHQIGESMRELAAINSDLQHCNHYWRKYTVSVLFSYIPQILFEVFSCIYVPMQSSVFIFGLTLTINMLSLVTQVCVFSATIIHKAYSMQRPLTMLYTRLSQFVAEKQGANDSEGHKAARWQLRKLSTFLEQYHHKRIGIYMLDFRLMDWNFYYDTLINCVVYFLLIVGVLHGAVEQV